MFPLAAAGLVGYLLGSIPAAYLIVRWKSSVDIRNTGSGNVGTLNSFQVTKSRAVGIAVLLADLAKGLAAVLAGKAIVPGDPFAGAAVAGIASVLGHNFPVWLGFRGGRGLATAAGVVTLLQWLILPVWAVGWTAGFLPVRKVNIGNIAGSLLVLLLAVLLPGDMLGRFVPQGVTPDGFRVFCVILLGVILVKHIEPLREYLKERRAARAAADRQSEGQQQ